MHVIYTFVMQMQTDCYLYGAVPLTGVFIKLLRKTVDVCFCKEKASVFVHVSLLGVNEEIIFFVLEECRDLFFQ